MDVYELDRRVTKLLDTLEGAADPLLIEDTRIDLHAGEFEIVTGRLLNRVKKGTLKVTPEQRAEIELLARESGLDT